VPQLTSTHTPILCAFEVAPPSGGTYHPLSEFLTMNPDTDTDQQEELNEEELVDDQQPDTIESDTDEEAGEESVDEVQRWKELAARNQAELENFRKRMARDKQEAILYANTSLLESLLPVLDNFEFGLQAAQAESEGSQVFLGMQMVKKQMDDFLSNQGVEEVAADGKEFDPNWQEAVGQEASDDVPEGSVIRTVRRGFKLGNRLLRAGSVVVSTGPATEEEAG